MPEVFHYTATKERCEERPGVTFGHVTEVALLEITRDIKRQLAEKCGLTPEAIKENHEGIATAEQNWQYHSPIKEGDKFSVKVESGRIKMASFWLIFNFFNSKGEKAATAGVKTCYFDTKAQRPKKIPDRMREKLLSMEQN